MTMAFKANLTGPLFDRFADTLDAPTACLHRRLGNAAAVDAALQADAANVRAFVVSYGKTVASSPAAREWPVPEVDSRPLGPHLAAMLSDFVKVYVATKAAPAVRDLTALKGNKRTKFEETLAQWPMLKHECEQRSAGNLSARPLIAVVAGRVVKRLIAETGAMFAPLENCGLQSDFSARSVVLGHIRNSSEFKLIVDRARTEIFLQLQSDRESSWAGGPRSDLKQIKMTMAFFDIIIPQEREALVDYMLRGLQDGIAAKGKGMTVDKIRQEMPSIIRAETECFAALFGDDVGARAKAMMQKVVIGSNCERIAHDKSFGVAAVLKYPFPRGFEATKVDFADLVTLLDFDTTSVSHLEAAIVASTRTAISTRLAEVETALQKQRQEKLARAATAAAGKGTDIGSEAKKIHAALPSLSRILSEYKALIDATPARPNLTLSMHLCTARAVGESLPFTGATEEAVAVSLDDSIRADAAALTANSKATRGTSATTSASNVSPNATPAVDNAVLMIPFLRSEAKFLPHYKQALASRLLKRGAPVNFAIERHVVAALKTQLGATVGKQLKVMLEEAAKRRPTGLTTSTASTSKTDAGGCVDPTGSDVSIPETMTASAVWVNDAVWPVPAVAAGPFAQLQLPPLLRHVCDSAVTTAEAHRPMTTAALDPVLTTVDIGVSLFAHRVIVRGAAPQAVALLQFPTLDTVMSVGEVAAASGMTNTEAAFVLRSIGQTGLIVTTTASTLTAEDDDDATSVPKDFTAVCVKVNEAFMAGAQAARRVVLPSLAKVRMAGLGSSQRGR